MDLVAVSHGGGVFQFYPQECMLFEFHDVRARRPDAWSSTQPITKLKLIHSLSFASRLVAEASPFADFGLLTINWHDYSFSMKMVSRIIE